jgi:4-hydroxyphenylpyruvate dioxygenase
MSSVLTASPGPAIRRESDMLAIDYVELYVANAIQAAHFYRTALGLEPVLYRGPATGVRDRVSYVVQRGGIRLVLTGPLMPDGEIADQIRKHGDTVHDIAFRVESAAAAFGAVIARGGKATAAPAALEDEGGHVVKAEIGAFGDTVHSLIERRAYTGRFLPGFRPIDRVPYTPATGLLELDHIAISLESNRLDHWVEYYCRVFGFQQGQEEVVASEYSGMNSKVVQNRSGSIKLPLLEPVSRLRRSPVQEYLNFHCGEGVHHLAFLSDDIVNTVSRLEESGVEFMATPGAYYDVLESRVGPLPVPLDALRRRNILADSDASGGLLLQVFSKPLQTRPTLSLEIIQRVGSSGFGAGNVRALFDAAEREQLHRGNA